MNEQIKTIRATMPAVTNRVYLNTGSVGPLAQPTIDTLEAAGRHEFEFGRASISSFMQFKEQLPRLRTLLGDIVGAPADTIALTHHTTDGLNIVMHGLQWQPGDELLITNWEHQGGYLPAFTAAREHRLVLNTVHFDWEDSAEQIKDKLLAAVTPRTRLVLFSHVMWNTGIRLPLKEIVSGIHEKGAMALVDGAQSAGAIPLDLTDSGVDFYSLPGQKWLCGPEGLGALYVRPDKNSLVQPHWVGYRSLAMPTAFDFSGHFLPADGAKRFEVGSTYRPATFAMIENLEWIGRAVTWPTAYSRIEQIATYAWEELSKLDGINMITHRNAGSGLITFNLEGKDPKETTMALQDQGIILRWLADPYALRIATGFYNTEEDIDKLTAALQIS